MFEAPWVLWLFPLALFARGWLRRFAVVLLLLAAAGPAPPLSPGLTVVLLDQSPSAREATREAVRALRVEGPVRYLAFAERAEWVQNPHASPHLGEATDLAAAFEAARAAGPARILLLSDGLFNPAPPPAPVYAFPLEPSPHAALTGLLAPPFPTYGEEVEVRARVFLTHAAEATLRFEAGGQKAEVRRALPAGTSSVGFRFTLEAPTPLRVTLETPFGRDTLKTRVTPAGREEVLVLGDPSAARYLKAQGFSVTEAERLPQTLPRVVVVGASAEALGPLAPERLRKHLEEGGGLLFTTTPKGLFFGDWHRVFADLPLRPKPTRGAAFVLVLDVSGSMAGEKLARAVEGAKAALAAAREEDVIGLLVFNERPRWLVPPAPASYRQRRLAEERLDALRAGGGTQLAPALRAAREALAGQEAAPKAVLVVTDGATGGKEAALSEAAAAAREGVQIHVLALGADADRAFLQALADRGQGRYAEADPAALARAIAEAAREAFRAQAERGRYPLTLVPGPLTRELAPPPPATRLLPAEKKPWAKALLKSGALDVLAMGERGYGRVAALALDLGHDLKDWPETPRLLARLVRWLSDTPARPRVFLYRDRLTVMGRFREDLWLRTDGEELPLAPVAPFRYEARVPPGSGDLLVFEGSRLRFRVPRKTSPEWPSQEGREVLVRLAEASGGTLLEAPVLGPPPRVPTPLRIPLALAGLAVLILELLLRRLR